MRGRANRGRKARPSSFRMNYLNKKKESSLKSCHFEYEKMEIDLSSEKNPPIMVSVFQDSGVRGLVFASLSFTQIAKSRPDSNPSFIPHTDSSAYPASSQSKQSP